jgi:hypothetical protein
METDYIDKYRALIHKHKLDLTKSTSYPDTLLSIGEQQMGENTYPCSFGTAGNFSCIVGGSKSRKTFFKSLLCASYIGGQSSNYSHLIKGHREKESFILDFDTEQGLWHSKNVALRVGKMVGNDYQNYLPFALREMAIKERVEFIEYLLLEHIVYKKSTSLVFIDGLADLVYDVNDLKECNLLVQDLMRWTSQSNCHLVGVLHSNYGSSKPTGHLGSSIMKKAETVCVLNVNEKDKNITDVKFTFTRGFGIDDFVLMIDENGLPFTKGSVEEWI